VTWAIQVEGLSKLYRVGRGHARKFDSFYEVIADKGLAIAEKLTGGHSRRFLPERIAARPAEIQSEHLVLSAAQFEGAPEGHFWALRDISLTIDEGQRVGIIGRNGSGKSTLLKILSRITRPSEGGFRFRGRLISLLEVGTGFHPDLTGRENIFINAKINGMSDAEIRRKFDEIVDFSELGVQIDTPIKRYSSGMYMRLAFSVAAHLESEILIVDEVLAVGDAGFQRKCLDKMLEIGNSGRTLLFVSHDMDAVRKLCDSAIEVSHGRLVAQTRIAGAAGEGGEARPGVGQQSVAAAIADYSLDRKIRSERSWSEEEAPRTPAGGLAVLRAWLEDAHGKVRGSFAPGEEIGVRLEVGVASATPGGRARLDIATVTGRSLLTTSARVGLEDAAAGSARVVRCRIPAPFFNQGVFRLTLALADEADPGRECVVRDALDLVVLPGAEAEAGAAAARDTPLAPAFDWTTSASGATVAPRARRAAQILVAAYSLSQWAYLKRIASRLRERGETVAAVYFGPAGPGEAAIRESAAATGCAYFDHEAIAAALPPPPAEAVAIPAALEGGGPLLPEDHPYRVLVRRQVEAARRIFDESGARLVLVGEDGIGGDGALISIARRRAIPVVVTPYGIGETGDYDNFLDDKNREGVLNRVPDDAVGRFIRAHAAKWIRRRPYGEALVFPAEFLVARLLEGLDQPVPWAVQGGNANLIAVESPAMRRHYLREGIPEEKLADVGTVFCDAVLEAMREDPAFVAAFETQRKARAGRTSILVSLPPSYHDGRAAAGGLASYADFCRDLLGHCAMLPGAGVTVSIHPNTRPEDVEAIRATGARISDRWVVELIGQHDLFVTVYSSTIRWAIAARKPVVNLDLYGFRLPTYDGVPGVLTTRSLDELKRTVASLVGDDAEYHRVALAQAAAGADWGTLDGGNFGRLHDLAARLRAEARR
jgi:lipopolysaccharide transport system ATP-binding protein